MAYNIYLRQVELQADLLQYYTGDNEILRSFISKGNHLSYDIIRYFKSYDSKIFNDPIVNEEYISMLKELGVLMPDEEMIEYYSDLAKSHDDRLIGRYR